MGRRVEQTVIGMFLVLGAEKDAIFLSKKREEKGEGPQKGHLQYLPSARAPRYSLDLISLLLLIIYYGSDTTRCNSLLCRVARPAMLKQ